MNVAERRKWIGKKRKKEGRERERERERDFLPKAAIRIVKDRVGEEDGG